MSWDSFKKGKRNKRDVLKFEFELEQNIFRLNSELERKTYKHGPYSSFYIKDPKLRHIHKATVRDRILHHGIFRILNPIFEPTFIPSSFSCRVGKGNHKGVRVLERMARKVSKNFTRNCFALKCDVKKFFDSVDHRILLSFLAQRVKDESTTWLLKEVIGSFSTSQSDLFSKKGLPIGNLTSQLFANVYMNEFDQFIKHELKIKHYVRYTDDFIILSETNKDFPVLLAKIEQFLEEKLLLNLHPRKIEVRKLSQGIDFLGLVVRPHHKLLRTKTKNRVLKKLKSQAREYKQGTIGRLKFDQAFQSYLGLLSHANTHRFSQDLKNKIWFWMKEE